jgi:hypothetical protein
VIFLEAITTFEFTPHFRGIGLERQIGMFANYLWEEGLFSKAMALWGSQAAASLIIAYRSGVRGRWFAACGVLVGFVAVFLWFVHISEYGVGAEGHGVLAVLALATLFSSIVLIAAFGLSHQWKLALLLILGVSPMIDVFIFRWPLLDRRVHEGFLVYALNVVQIAPFLTALAFREIFGLFDHILLLLKRRAV